MKRGIPNWRQKIRDMATMQRMACLRAILLDISECRLKSTSHLLCLDVLVWAFLRPLVCQLNPWLLLLSSLGVLNTLARAVPS